MYLALHLQEKQQVWQKKIEVEKAALRLKMMEEENLQSKEEEIELQRLREKQHLQDNQQKRLQEEFERAQIQAKYCKKWQGLQQKAKESQLEYKHALEEDECMQEQENASKGRELADLLCSETLEDHVKQLGDELPGDVN